MPQTAKNQQIGHFYTVCYTMSMNAVILIIEDEQDISDFVTKLLIDQGHTVYSAGKGIEGLDLAEKVNPDLVVLDLNLPDIDGESVCKQIKENSPETQVLMLTARDTSRDLTHGLNIGADDYMTKPFEPDVLRARVNARLRTHKNDDEILRVADVTLNPKTHELLRGQTSIELSPQEYKLLHYFMTNPNQVLTREMIIARIWEASPDIETRVVDVYVGYLRKKLDKGRNDGKLFVSVRGFGYMMKDPNADKASTQN
jgi:two-component system OmpR family response regulator